MIEERPEADNKDSLRAWLAANRLTGWRRTFAAVRPTTRSRIDLVVRLDDVKPEDHLLDGRNSPGRGLNLHLDLRFVDDLDDLDDEAVRVSEKGLPGQLVSDARSS